MLQTVKLSIKWLIDVHKTYLETHLTFADIRARHRDILRAGKSRWQVGYRVSL